MEYLHVLYLVHVYKWFTILTCVLTFVIARRKPGVQKR